jgi:hypothetical protein
MSNNWPSSEWFKKFKNHYMKMSGVSVRADGMAIKEHFQTQDRLRREIAFQRKSLIWVKPICTMIQIT